MQFNLLHKLFHTLLIITLATASLLIGAQPIHALESRDFNWKPIRDVAPVNGDPWRASAMSSDGQVMMTNTFNQDLFRSEDGGMTWRLTEIYPDRMMNTGESFGMSGDGQTVFVAPGAVNTNLFKSTDGAKTWVEVQPVVLSSQVWDFVALSADGQTVLAGILNGRLYRSTDAGASWSETQPAGNVNRAWGGAALSDDGEVIYASIKNGSIVYKSSDQGQTWTALQPGGSTNRSWVQVATNADGSSVVTQVGNGHVYISHDGGDNWQLRTPPSDGQPRYWRPSAMSADGQIIIAQHYLDQSGINRDSKMYRSEDGGVTWQDITPHPELVNNNWTIAMSADGSSVLSANFQKKLYLSHNGGAQWDILTPAGPHNRSWSTAVISESGKTQLATSGEGRINFSNDWGSSWAELQPEGDASFNWSTSSLSPNGQWLLVGRTAGGLLHKSGDHGQSWTEISPKDAVRKIWYSSYISDDGQFVMLGSNSGRLHRSYDGGVTWNEVQPAGDTNQTWNVIDVSKDLTTIYAGVNSGRLYRSLDGGDTWSEVRPDGDANYVWNSLQISSDNQSVLAAHRLGLYSSNDQGQSWSEIEVDLATLQTIASATATDDFSRIIVGVNNGLLRQSLNGGSTWTEYDIAGGRQQWRKAVMSKNGRIALVAGHEEELYLGRVTPPTPTLSMSEASFSIDEAKLGVIALTGTGPAGYTVEVEVNSEPQSGTVIVDDSGSWRWMPPLALSEGEHRYRARVIEDDMPGPWSEWLSFQVLGMTAVDSIPETGTSLWLVRAAGGVVTVSGGWLLYRQRRQLHRVRKNLLPRLY